MSLIEVLLTVALIAITLGATLNAFTAGLTFESKFLQTRSKGDEIVAFEDQISQLIAGADLSDGASVLVSPVPADSSGSQAPQTSGTGLAPGSASLIFTTWSDAPPQRYLDRTDSDWETLNTKFGVQGATDEVALSMTPLGDAGLLRGLFLREQRPPSPDPSKGGTERLLSPMIKDIRFEFFDGTNWQTAWDTRSGDEKGKLPASIRVTYLSQDDPSPHSFVTRIRAVPKPASGGQS